MTDAAETLRPARRDRASPGATAKSLAAYLARPTTSWASLRTGVSAIPTAALAMHRKALAVHRALAFEPEPVPARSSTWHAA